MELSKDQQKVYGNLSMQYLSDFDKQDCLQFAIERILKEEKTFNDINHFRNYLVGSVNSKRIDIWKNQTKENLVSLSIQEVQNEVSNIHVSVNDNKEKESMLPWILSQTKSNGKSLFTDKQKDILKYRSQGLSQKDIAEKMDVIKQAISKACKTIDSKILKLPIKGKVSEKWYKGIDTNHKRKNYWKELEIQPVKIKTLKNFKRTRNEKSLQSFHDDSNRALQQHIKIIGETAKPITLDSIPHVPHVPHVHRIPRIPWDSPTKKPMVDMSINSRKKRLIKRYSDAYMTVVKSSDNFKRAMEIANNTQHIFDAFLGKYNYSKNWTGETNLKSKTGVYSAMTDKGFAFPKIRRQQGLYNSYLERLHKRSVLRDKGFQLINIYS